MTIGSLQPVSERPTTLGTALAIEDMLGDAEMSAFNTAEDVGGCWVASQRFAWYLSKRGEAYSFRRWRNAPAQRTPFQHNIEVAGLIFDWTYRQIDPNAAWPHIEDAASFEARLGPPLAVCPACGRIGGHPSCPGIRRTSIEAIAASATN